VSIDELLPELTNLIRSKNQSSIFINGPRGSGKSRLANDLAKILQSQIPNCIAIGPVSIDTPDSARFAELLLSAMKEMGFLGSDIDSGGSESLSSTWSRINEYGQIPRRQHFIILGDFGPEAGDQTEELAQLFSSARELEASLREVDFKLCIIFFGAWNHPSLEKHYLSSSVSFPYTVGVNYFRWTGIAVDRVREIARSFGFPRVDTFQTQSLHQLSGGNPAVMEAIIECLPAKDLTLESMLKGVEEAALNSQIAEALLKSWQHIHSNFGGRIVGELFAHGVIPEIPFPPAAVEAFLSGGLVRRFAVGAVTYLRFHSWFVEVVVRLRSDEIDEGYPRQSIQDIRELVPNIGILNVRAYGIVNQIENDVRNLVISRLIGGQSNDKPLLAEKGNKLDRDGVLKDAHTRALQWRDSAAEKQVNTHINPLICYLSTRDLSELVSELSKERNSNSWLDVGDALREIAVIRDLVMHNQLIDDATSERLELLQEKIYSAFNLPSEQ